VYAFSGQTCEFRWNGSSRHVYADCILRDKFWSYFYISQYKSINLYLLFNFGSL